MRYLLLVYDNEDRVASLSESALTAEVAEYQDFGHEFGARIRSGDALQPTSMATTVSVRHGKRVIRDGASDDPGQQLGRYCLVEADDLDVAIGMAARIPGARFGRVEVRPIRQFA